MTKKLISIIVPIFNEEACIEVLHRRLQDVAALCAHSLEIVYVDDGSTDKTPSILKSLQSAVPVHVMRLSRNFGQQRAISAALTRAKGDAVVIMDADLQDPPELLVQLIAEWEQGADIVYVLRSARSESSLMRSCYWLYYRVLSALSPTPIILDTGDFGLLSRRVVDVLVAMPESHRFLRGLRAWIGYRQVGIVHNRAPRFAGRTKYSFRRLFQLAADGIFSFSIAPLRLASLLGFAGITLSAIFLLAAIVVKLFASTFVPTGFTALLFFIVFAFGIQMVSIGILGEYIGRIYEEVKRRPLFLVDEEYRLDK